MMAFWEWASPWRSNSTASPSSKSIPLSRAGQHGLILSGASKGVVSFQVGRFTYVQVTCRSWPASPDRACPLQSNLFIGVARPGTC